MINNIGLVDYVKSKLGVNYCYGTKMEVLTQAKYEWLKKTYGTNCVWESDRKKIGTLCTDCSGLISSYTGIERNSSGYKAQAKSLNPMSTITDAPMGALVWYDGHIGVYIGNGDVVEARGSAYGVVQTKAKDRGWKYWFLCSDLEYVNPPSFSVLVDGLTTKAGAERLKSELANMGYSAYTLTKEG